MNNGFENLLLLFVGFCMGLIGSYILKEIKGMKKHHELHNHPVTEMREGIDSEKVLVDIEFKELFSEVWEYWDNKHVIVLRREYEELIAQ